MARGKSGKAKSHRSAGSGKYVTEKYAKSHPKTTIAHKRAGGRRKK